MKSEYLIALRCTRGLEEDDNSQDEQIIKMSPDSKFKSFVGWHFGDSEWADIVIDAAVDFELVKK